MPLTCPLTAPPNPLPQFLKVQLACTREWSWQGPGTLISLLFLTWVCGGGPVGVWGVRWEKRSCLVAENTLTKSPCTTWERRDELFSESVSLLRLVWRIRHWGKWDQRGWRTWRQKKDLVEKEQVHLKIGRERWTGQAVNSQETQSEGFPGKNAWGIQQMRTSGLWENWEKKRTWEASQRVADWMPVHFFQEIWCRMELISVSFWLLNASFWIQ